VITSLYSLKMESLLLGDMATCHFMTYEFFGQHTNDSGKNCIDLGDPGPFGEMSCHVGGLHSECLLVSNVNATLNAPFWS